MANHALVIGWNRAVPGLEKRALEGFQRSMSVYAKAVADKKIESFEPIFLAAHGGDLNGFVLVKGDRDKLHAWRWSEEFLELEYEAMQYLQGLGVNEAVAGDGIGPTMALYAKSIK